MGTTLVSLFIDRDYKLAYWAHAGDSRLYLFRRGWLYHVTTDHSLVQQMKDAGHQTDDINSNLLYRALGMASDVRKPAIAMWCRSKTAMPFCSVPTVSGTASAKSR